MIAPLSRIRKTCPSCGATAPDTSKERKRFERRHFPFCPSVARKAFNKQLAEGTRSTEPTTWEEHQALREES